MTMSNKTTTKKTTVMFKQSNTWDIFVKVSDLWVLTGAHCESLSAATNWTFMLRLCDFPLDLISRCNTCTAKRTEHHCTVVNIHRRASWTEDDLLAKTQVRILISKLHRTDRSIGHERLRGRIHDPTNNQENKLLHILHQNNLWLLLLLFFLIHSPF